MKIDKIIEESIKQIQAGVISANNDLNYHFAYMPSMVKFNLSVDTNNNPSEDKMEFTICIENELD